MYIIMYYLLCTQHISYPLQCFSIICLAVYWLTYGSFLEANIKAIFLTVNQKHFGLVDFECLRFHRRYVFSYLIFETTVPVAVFLSHSKRHWDIVGVGIRAVFIDCHSDTGFRSTKTFLCQQCHGCSTEASLYVGKNMAWIMLVPRVPCTP